MRTYDAATYRAARRAWAEGEFGPEWRWVFALSWERGFPYPPAGTVHDDREGGSPSQRAIVYHALDEQPTELRRILEASRSWSQVIDRIIGLERRLSEDAGMLEKDARWDRDQETTHREAAASLASILARIADSVGAGS